MTATGRPRCSGVSVTGKRAGQPCLAVGSIEIDGVLYCKNHAPRPRDLLGATTTNPIVVRVRRSLPARLRFEVFKRDCFTCQYCGRKAPDVLLEADHLHPVAKGGPNDLLNMVTACRECNQGKGARLLADDSALARQQKQLEELQERREQLDLLVQWKEELIRVKDDAAVRVAAFWGQVCPGWHVNTPTGIASVKKMVHGYGPAEVMDAMQAAVHQYVKLVDGKVLGSSVQSAWSYVPRILRMKREHEKNPALKELFYIRGIVRNRLTYYCKDHVILDMIKDVHTAGGSIEEMKDIAIRARNWSGWKSAMESYLGELKGGA